MNSASKGEGEQSQKGDDFGKFFSQQTGPGGCKNEQECFAYCNDPAHGAECISFGAKHEVFKGNEAVERYQKYNDILNNPSPSNYNQTGQYGQGQYGENRFNQRGQNPSGQTYPYPVNDNRGYVNQGGFNNSGPIGPSPECFAAIQSGDFVKAKEFAVFRLILISRHINRKTGHAPLLTRSRVPRGNTGSRDSRTIVPFSASACRYPAIRISNLPRR